MKRTLLALALVALAAAGWPAARLAAQESKMARGAVTAVAADSLTVKVGGQDMKFIVDSKTNVEAVGAGTKSRQAQAAGAPGPKLTDVVKVGQPVAVSYTETGGSNHATRIRAISSLAAEPGATSGPGGAKTANGTVKSVAATSMTISGSSGSGATFTQTFTIDGTTKVIGKGAGTASAAAGGKTVITELVSNGDAVSVTYHAAGNALHAAEIRVTNKAGVSK
jgi:cobalamin biosynthesis Mg chelatase CobN